MKKSQLNKKLLCAVETNSCDQVDPLLRASADPLANNSRALVAAIELGRTEIIKKFVRHGVDVDQPWTYPLKTAVENNQLETLTYLHKSFRFTANDLEAACLFAIEKDWGQALAILLDGDADLDFSPVEECLKNDAINCFPYAIKYEFTPQNQMASIVEKCVKNSVPKFLRYALGNYMVGTQVMNSLLVDAACQSSTDVLGILINHGATGPDESTKAFIAAIENSDWIDGAELLLPQIDISQIDDRDLANLATHCEWDLVKQVLKRGVDRPVCELDPMFATDFVSQLDPEDFFVLDDGLPITRDFLNERLGFCRELAQGATDYQKHYAKNDIDEKVKISKWLLRAMEIRSALINNVRQLRPA